MNARRILVAVDGSEQSLWAVQYISRCIIPDKAEVTLLHVFSPLPEPFWDMRDMPGYRQAVAGMLALESGRRLEMEKFMERASAVLSASGFSRDKIVVNTVERRVGIARDIAFEAQRGFDAVVLGRTGLSWVKDILLGGTATKILGKLAGIPLCLVGGQPDPSRLLIAVDGSQGAERAVDFVGSGVGWRDMDIQLLNVQRGLSFFVKEYGEMEGGSPAAQAMALDLTQAERDMEKALQAARSRLVEAGFAAERISLLMVKDAPSRATTIVEQANLGGYGSIVVGRRGISRIREFIMGRVSNKVISLARNHAVWVVG